MSNLDEDRLLDRLARLVRTRSVTGDETAAVDLIASWLGESGADEVDRWNDTMTDLERDPEYPGREVERDEVPVVAARAAGKRRGPTVVLTGHVDTVGVGEASRWSHDPFGGERDGDRLYGRGACDMKAGLLAALEVFSAIAGGDRDFAGEVRFVAVPGEEDGGTGTLSAIRRNWGGDMVILTEPTGGDIVVAHGGALTFTIEVEGRAAHGSSPDGGVSALDAFYTVYRAMRDAEGEVNEGETDPRMRALGMPYATTVGIVSGGSWASNVMELLRADARVGVKVGESIGEAEQRFTDSVLRRTAEDEWLGDHPPRITRTGAAFGSSSIDPSDPLVAMVQASVEAVTGRRPDLVGAPYGCDMALWRRVGRARCLVYGPGQVAQAHVADEWVSVTETVEVAGVLSEAIGRIGAHG